MVQIENVFAPIPFRRKEMKTVSFETAKKLKAAGWNKRTFFEIGSNEQNYCRNEDTPKDVIVFDSPTLDEILEELPTCISISDKNYFVFMVKENNDPISSYDIGYMESRSKTMFTESHSHSPIPANGMARLWLWCVEKGYVKP